MSPAVPPPSLATDEELRQILGPDVPLPSPPPRMASAPLQSSATVTRAREKARSAEERSEQSEKISDDKNLIDYMVAEPITKDILELFTQIDNADDFRQLHFTDFPPYRWQIEQLLQLSGYRDPYKDDSKVSYTKENPFLMTLCAANGSGKDQIVLAIWALFSICCKQDFHWIGTSSSYNQLHEQTWRHIRRRAEQLNSVYGKGFLYIKKHKIVNRHTRSEITLFRTDEELKTEGFHPLCDGAQMAIVLNECKSLEPEIVKAFKRCHGYSHWLNISSPGDPFGYFYEKCTNADAVNWPNPLIPGKDYFRRIDYTQCPHLLSEYNREVTELGTDEDAYILSTYKALFVPQSQLYIIPPDRIKYEYPAKNTLGMPRRAGLDLSLGGDATVLSVWEGNYFVLEYEIREPHEPTLTEILVAKIRELNIDASQVYADAGGSGTPIIQRIREAGLNINGVHNQSTPRNKKIYRNRGTELAFNFRRLVLDKVLNLSGTSEKLRRQMGQRYYEIKEGKNILEDKPSFRARTGYSPDHFDAAILAHAGCNFHVFKAAAAVQDKQQDPHTLPVNWRKQYDEIYGNLDTRRANSGDWRTSGIYNRRKIGKPLRAFDR